MRVSNNSLNFEYIVKITDAAINRALGSFKKLISREMYEKVFSNMKLGAANRSIMADLTRESLQETAVHDKEYTVKLTSLQAGKPYMRDDILSAFVEAGLAAKDIVAVGPLNENSRWLVTLTDKDVVIKTLSLTPIVKGHSTRVYSLVSSIVQCRVHWLPVYIPMAELVIHMCQFGVVQSCSWDYSKIPGFQHVRSTVRNIVLDLAAGTEIPSLDKLFFDGLDKVKVGV